MQPGKQSTKSPVQTKNEQLTVSIQEFNIEMNAKNRAYAFILSNKLLDDFSKFCKETSHIKNLHSHCLTFLNKSL